MTCSVWATSGQGYLFSQIVKPITTARRQVTMRQIACTIKKIEMRNGINIVDWAEVRLIEPIKTWRKFGVITIIIGRGGSTNRGVNMPTSVNTCGRVEIVLIQTLKTRGGVVGGWGSSCSR